MVNRLTPAVSGLHSHFCAPRGRRSRIVGRRVEAQAESKTACLGLLGPGGVRSAGLASERFGVSVAGGSSGGCGQLSVDFGHRARRDAALGRSPFSDAGERGIDVVLERGDDKWVAKLYLRIDAGETDAARVIESTATDCAELGKSVALAVSLAIAPDLPPEPKPEPAPTCPPLPPPAPPRRLPRLTLHGEASLRALFSPNLLPTTSVGAALAVTLHGDLVGASFGGLFYPESQLRAVNAHLGFGVSAAFASGCLWARTKDPQVWSCIGARVGALHAVVYSPEPTSPGDRLWWAASSELGLRQHLFGRAFLEAGAAAVFPFVRHRFEVDSSTTPSEANVPADTKVVYEQGPAVVEAFFGLGLRLD